MKDKIAQYNKGVRNYDSIKEFVDELGALISEKYASHLDESILAAEDLGPDGDGLFLSSFPLNSYSEGLESEDDLGIIHPFEKAFLKINTEVFAELGDKNDVTFPKLMHHGFENRNYFFPQELKDDFPIYIYSSSGFF